MEDKILIKSDDELVDLVRKISETKQERVVLKFPEESDLLISPINFKVLLKVADKLNKILVAQILHSQTGVANAEIVGMVTTTDSNIDEDLWLFALAQTDERKNRQKDALKGVVKKEDKAPKTEEITPAQVEDKQEGLKAEPKTEQEEELQEKEIDIESLIEGEGFEKKTGEIGTKSIEQSEFQKRVDQTLQGLKPVNNKLIEAEGFEIALDDDIENFVSPVEKFEDFEIKEEEVKQEAEKKTEEIPAKQREIKVKMDELKEIPAVQDRTSQEDDVYSSFISKDFKSAPNIRDFRRKPKITIPKLNFASIKVKINQLKASGFKGGSKKMLPIVGGFLVITAILFYFIYTIASQAVVTVYYKSTTLSIDKTFTGKLNSAFDLSAGTVAVVSHEVSKESSESTLVTGTGERGKKATGSVTLRCYKDGAVNLTAGTKIKTADNKEFKIASAQNLTCPTTLSGVVIEALNFGSDYNIQSGTVFSVEGYPSADLVAQNSTAFTGGTKETYKMVAKEDIDNIVKGLQEPMDIEALEELQNWGASEGWVMIPKTVVNKLDGDPAPDAPVGTETDIVNVVVKTKHSAYYYNKKDLDNAVGQIIEQEKGEELLNAQADQGNTTVSYELTKEDRNAIEVKMIIASVLKPEIDKDKIIADLTGLGWKDGVEYLDDLDFHAKDPELSFSPEWVPKFLWKFPKGHNKIILHVREIE
jgi:hypothetical protein